jgi:hypothetical protein
MLAQAGMQISKKSGHLIVCESPGKGRHHSLASQDNSSNFFVRNWCAARKRRMCKYPVQIRRNFLQAEIVVLVAMCAAHRIEMLPFRLLRGECRRYMAANKSSERSNAQSDARARDPGHFLQSH